jgi:Zn-finger nucleic acid-binding protein
LSNLSAAAGGSRLAGPGLPAPLAVAKAVDWSSLSVVELEAFPRSRGVVLDLGGEGERQPDRATLVEIATAIAADHQEEQQQQQGRQEGNLDR